MFTREKSTHQSIELIKIKMSEIDTTKSVLHGREKELKTNSSDSIQSKQNQNLEPVLKKASQMSDYSSIRLSPNNPSSQTIPGGYSNDEFYRR